MFNTIEEVPEGLIVRDSYLGLSTADMYVLKLGGNVYINHTGNPITIGWVELEGSLYPPFKRVDV